MRESFGFGKTIILGEHFVVHNKPALVAALPLKTQAIVVFNDSDQLIFTDNRPLVHGFIASKTAAYSQMLENILIFLKISQRNFTITVSGDLTVTCGGIGASAACAVSIIKAFDRLLNLNMNDATINDAAIFAESAIHGTPSGIDNTAATFGGIFEYSKQGGLTQINIAQPIKILLVDSSKQTDTKSLISKVNKFLNDEPDKSADIFNRYTTVFNSGLAAIKAFDLALLGQCMNQNHELLQKLGLSCTELDYIVNKAIELGALGAKLTGTGGGGLALILLPDDSDVQKKIKNFFDSNNFFIIKSELKSLKNKA
ncbi:MAG: hypothetical protein US49_C0014G0012 [candidate division TM6 bacterium GW2011_GWF2_37_49]|nr:MAG: hypothetical protein US49_C0014G0012 [candidate division TM6 bacterium GW2011_GWF2_37_49]